MALYEVVMGSCLGVILAAQAVLFVCSGGHVWCLKRLAGVRRRLLALAASKSCRASPAKDGLIEQKVADLIMRRRVKMFIGFLVPVSLWSFCCAGYILWMISSGSTRWMSAVIDIAFLLFHTFLLILICNPHWIHPGSLNFWTSALMCTHLIIASPLGLETIKLPLLMSATLGARLIMSLCMSPTMFTSWNVAYLIVLSLHSLSSPAILCECDSVVWNRGIIFAGEVTACLSVLAINWAAQTVMEAEAWRHVEASASRSGREAARSLLGTMCDAVVELDAELRLTDHSPSLAAVLLHGPVVQSLSGTKLDQFMYSEDDKVRFNSYLQVPAHDTGAIADAFHLKMRDSLGSMIDLELFHVCFLDGLTEASQHLVGLREHSDACMADPCLSSQQATLADASVRHHPQQPEIAVIFDALSFDILRVSDAFTARFGASPPGAAFSDWLSQEGLGSFCDRVNSFANSGTPSCNFDLGHQSLQLPCAVDPSPDAVAPRFASCTLVAHRGADGERVLACLVLSTDHELAPTEGRSFSSTSGSSMLQRFGRLQEAIELQQQQQQQQHIAL